MALIKCEECGQMVSDKATECPNCGNPITSTTFRTQPMGASYQEMQYQQKQSVNDPTQGTSGKSPVVFGMLAICLGGLGAHFFYIGKTGAGIVNILCCTIGCLLLLIPPSIIAILVWVQGIIAFCGTQEEFERRYVYSDNFYPI